ncbi:organic cation transporter protein-like isoform X2 [Argopecten irradians]|uniref:organic cation transporter protein-like isoform X2 n=1 Tax=Argopecten irradians TaxID=31199 RepID=UPI00371B75C5
MNFDKVIASLGAFGRYQKYIYFLVCLASVFSGLFTVISAVLLAVPQHRCKIPGYDNDTYTVQSRWHQSLIDQHIPSSKDGTYDNCHLYLLDNSSYWTNVSKVNCDAWVYSKDVFTETFTSMNNLVCRNAQKTAMAKSFFFAGVLVGAITIGHISDVFGRKTSLLVGAILLIASTLSLAWSPNFTFFSVCMLFIGVASEGMYAPGLIIGLELVGPSKRSFTGTLTNHFFALGIMALSGMAYFIRHWKHLELACAVPCVFFLFYYWLLPESPRWLITKQRFSEAKKILRKAARVNRVSLADDMLDISRIVENTSKNRIGSGRKFCQLLNSRVFLPRMIIISFNMCVITMSYYGLTLNTENLGGNFYLNFCLSGLVELPAYTIPLLLMDRIGRKRLFFVCMIVCGVACISTLLTTIYLDQEYQSLNVTLALLGKLGISAAFSIILVYSAELFPTVVRGTALSSCSIFGRIGGIVASYVAESGDLISGRIGKAFPMLIFGVLSLVAAFLALILPETMGQELPETIQDGVLFGKPEYKKDTVTNCMDGAV